MSTNHTPLQIKIGAKCYKSNDIVNEIVRSLNIGDEDTFYFFGDFLQKRANLYDAPPSIPLTHIIFNFFACVLPTNTYNAKEKYIREKVVTRLNEIGYNMTAFNTDCTK